jgi:hypothetical protein
MTATRLPPPPFNTPLLEAGFVSSAWQFFVTALYNIVYEDGADKVEAAHAAAQASVRQSTQVIAGGGLQVGGQLSDNVAIALYRVKAAVAALPRAGNAEGDWAYAINGRKPAEAAGSGTGVPCFWSNGAWVAATSGAPVAA